MAQLEKKWGIEPCNSNGGCPLPPSPIPVDHLYHPSVCNGPVCIQPQRLLDLPRSDLNRSQPSATVEGTKRISQRTNPSRHSVPSLTSSSREHGREDRRGPRPKSDGMAQRHLFGPQRLRESRTRTYAPSWTRETPSHPGGLTGDKVSTQDSKLNGEVQPSRRSYNVVCALRSSAMLHCGKNHRVCVGDVLSVAFCPGSLQSLRMRWSHPRRGHVIFPKWKGKSPRDNPLPCAYR